MQPERIQLSRKKGYRLPPLTKSVARPSIFGNPYRIEVFGRELSLILFRQSAVGGWSPSHFDGKPDHLIEIAYRVHTKWQKRFFGCTPLEHARSLLRGYNLACWCQPEDPCHADIWLEVVNGGGRG